MTNSGNCGVFCESLTLVTAITSDSLKEKVYKAAVRSVLYGIKT